MLSNDTTISDSNSSLVSDEAVYSQSTLVFFYVFIPMIVSVTVIGNILVILAFIVDKSLRSQSNFFLLNLAVCDFFIGAFCIPVSVPFTLTGKWTFGRFLCKLWLVTDNLMCTASVFSVVLISYDRFLSITMAIAYRSQQKKHSLTILKIGALWILAFLLYSPAILLWNDEDTPSFQNDCVPGFFYTWYFLLGASTFDFYLPILSITYFNLSICWNIALRSRKRKEVITSPTSLSSDDNETPAGPSTISGNIVFEGKEETKKQDDKSNKTFFLLKLKKCSNVASSLESDKAVKSNMQAIQLSRDKRVAKSLTVLVCIFGVCWAPYTLFQSIRAACHDTCIDYSWNEVTGWLLWLNSSINPVIYPLCHRSFRKALMKLLLMFSRRKS